MSSVDPVLIVPLQKAQAVDGDNAPLYEPLQVMVSTGLDCKLIAKHAHWNVVDPNFIGIHELFDEIVDVLDSGVDAIAERLRQLGGFVDGTTMGIVTNSIIEPVHQNAPEDAGQIQHIVYLADCIKSYSTMLKHLIAVIQNGDPVTADVLIKVSGELDKQLFLLVSHLPG